MMEYFTRYGLEINYPGASTQALCSAPRECKIKCVS